MEAFLARALCVAVGCAALVWGAASFPIFWRQAGLETTADLIIEGHRYATPDLVKEISAFDTPQGICRWGALRSAAVVRLRLVEDALGQGDRLVLDQRLADLKGGIRDLFACDPADSFFWLVYYWANLTTDGFRPDLLKFLAMSYRQGPNEGWIATKRSRLALAIYPQLPPELSERALTEFVGIVRSGLIVEAAAILTGPGWSIRNELLDRLNDVPLVERERLAALLRDRGYDVAVPGVKAPQQRLFQ